MNNIDVSQISNKGNVFNTDQDLGISRSSSHCERIIFPISKQEDSHILTMTDSRSRKHRIFKPFQSEKRNANFNTNNQELTKKHENRIRKNQFQIKKGENGIQSIEDCLKSRAKITFKIPKISEYYIGEKLQTTTHRLNYALRMNSLINPKSLLQPEDEREEKKEGESSASLPELKTLKQFKKKDSLKQKKQGGPSYGLLSNLQLNQTMVIYMLIGLAVLGFTLNMLFH